MKNIRLAAFLIVCGAMLVVNSCSNPINNINLTPSNTVSYTLKGTTWNSAIATYSNNHDSIRVVATNGQGALTLLSVGIKAPGTYHFSFPDSGAIALAYVTGTEGPNYTSLPTGTITITSISASTLKATFSTTMLSQKTDAFGTHFDTVTFSNGSISMN